MSEAKHTPGPWTTQDGESGETIWIGNSDSNVACVPGYTDHPLNIANARMIAAAPNMLALLQELIDIEGPQPGTSAWAQKVKSAIAKATGAA